MIHEITTQTKLLELGSLGKKLFVMDFYTDWCGPCRKVGPFFKETSEKEEYGEILFIKVNGDEADELLQIFGIKGFPTFLFGRISGANVSLLNKVMGADEKGIIEKLEELKVMDFSVPSSPMEEEGENEEDGESVEAETEKDKQD